LGDVQKGRSTITQSDITLEEMLHPIGNRLSDVASSDNEEDGEDEDDHDEDTGHGKLSEDDEPGWVIGTIFKAVQYHMESLGQEQMRHDELTQPGWGNTSDYFREWDLKYGTTELNVPVVGKPQTVCTAATPSPTIFAQLMHALDMVPGQSQMLQVTSRQGSSEMRLISEKLQANNYIEPLMPIAVPNSSQIDILKPGQQVSFYHCISRPESITLLTSYSDDDMVMAPASPEGWIPKYLFLTTYLV
jgi:hypothetical protein